MGTPAQESRTEKYKNLNRIKISNKIHVSNKYLNWVLRVTMKRDK